MVQTSGAHRYDEREARWGISFYTSAHAKALYKETVRRIVTRVNSVDGVAYKDDPAIFGWELGAELYDTSAYLDPDILAKAAEGDFDWLAKWRRGNPPPSAWTREMATAIKILDPNHLVVDGANTVEGSRRAKNHRGSSSTEDSNDAPVRSVGTSAARRKRDVERVPFEPIEPAGSKTRLTKTMNTGKTTTTGTKTRKTTIGPWTARRVVLRRREHEAPPAGHGGGRDAASAPDDDEGVRTHARGRGGLGRVGGEDAPPRVRGGNRRGSRERPGEGRHRVRRGDVLERGDAGANRGVLRARRVRGRSPEPPPRASSNRCGTPGSRRATRGTREQELEVMALLRNEAPRVVETERRPPERRRTGGGDHRRRGSRRRPSSAEPPRAPPPRVRERERRRGGSRVVLLLAVPGGRRPGPRRSSTSRDPTARACASPENLRAGVVPSLPSLRGRSRGAVVPTLGERRALGSANARGGRRVRAPRGSRAPPRRPRGRAVTGTIRGPCSSARRRVGVTGGRSPTRGVGGTC